MALVIDRPHFKLDATVERGTGTLFNFELKQLHPNAQRPHWRRITQLNPTREELIALRNAIDAALSAAEPRACCACGATENLFKDTWMGSTVWRCASSGCQVF